MTTIEYRQLGKSDLYLSPIGLGTWQFSGSNGIGSRFWNTLSQHEADDIVRVSLLGGVNWIDTAEAYGNGVSELMIAQALKNIQKDTCILPSVYIADKWWPLGRRASSLKKTISERRRKLDGRIIDLYQIHHPTSISTLKAQMREMKQLITQGDIRYIGVSNFTAKQMKKANTLLKEEGLSLISNQVRYNLFDRSIERNGILETAKQLGISIIAYSPLHQGLLTGKFHENPDMLDKLFWVRKMQYNLTNKTLKHTKALIDTMSEIGRKYDRPPAQIALNWLIHAHGKNVFAIPGATTLSHVQVNLGAMEFKLSPEELAALNELSL